MQFDVPKSPQYYTKDLSDFLGVDFTSIAPNEHRASNLINLVNNDGYLETRPGYDEVSSFAIQAPKTIEFNNATLSLTAIRKGDSGNTISISFVNPGKPSKKLKFSEENGTLVYTLATDKDGNITTTFQDIMDIYNHYVTMTCTNPNAVVTALAATFLTGGENHPINGIWNYDEDMTNIFLVHVENKLYKVSSDFQTKTLITSVSNLNNSKSEAVFMDNKLLIFDGKRVIVYGKLTSGSDVYSAGYADEYGYIPTTTVNMNPNGTGNTDKYYESVNLLTPYRWNSYVADGVSTTYYWNEAQFGNGYDNEQPVVLVINPNTGVKEQYRVASYDYQKGSVTLAGAPPKFPVEGRDSVFIKFKKTPAVDKSKDLINKWYENSSLKNYYISLYSKEIFMNENNILDNLSSHLIKLKKELKEKMDNMSKDSEIKSNFMIIKIGLNNLNNINLKNLDDIRYLSALKIELKIEKLNKTFYLEKRYIDILEDLSSKTGVNTSELVQAAIQLLKNNTVLEGFDD